MFVFLLFVDFIFCLCLFRFLAKPTPRPTPKPTPRPTRWPTPSPTRMFDIVLWNLYSIFVVYVFDF